MLPQTQEPPRIFLIAYKDGSFNTSAAPPNPKHFRRDSKFFVCDADLTIVEINDLQFYNFNPEKAGVSGKIQKFKP